MKKTVLFLILIAVSICANAGKVVSETPVVITERSCYSIGEESTVGAVIGGGVGTASGAVLGDLAFGSTGRWIGGLAGGATGASVGSAVNKRQVCDVTVRIVETDEIHMYTLIDRDIRTRDNDGVLRTLESGRVLITPVVR